MRYLAAVYKLGIRISNVMRTRKAKRITAIFLFSFCLGVNIYFRLFPAYFPQLKETAKLSVSNEILEDVNKTVEELYPAYNDYAKSKIINDLFKRKLEDKKAFKEKVSEKYQSLKDKYQDSFGRTYLLELDPYQWMRYTENVLKYGHPGDKKIGKDSYDTYMLAPKGTKIFYAQFLFYFSAFFYKIFSFFRQGVELSRFLFYLPLFYTSIFLSLVYFFCRRIFSSLAAFFTVLFIGLSDILIIRGAAGWYDYDILSLIVPLLIVWFLLEALNDKNGIKRIVFYSFLAAFFQGLYPAVWIGWWFIFLVIAGFFFCSILNNYLIYPRDLKRGSHENKIYFISAAVFFTGSIIFSFLFSGTNPFGTIISQVFDALRLGKSLSASIWPNTYYTVGELTPVNLAAIAHDLYGETIFLVLLASMFWVFYKERRGGRKNFFYMMFFWFVFMLFASLKSVRFGMFLSVPLGFFLGGFIDGVYLKIKNKFWRSLRLKLFTCAVFFLGCGFLLKVFLFSGLDSARHIAPLMNDDWQKALTYLKENTPLDAVINSWWDYGDLFKTVGKRRVIFDGQSQNRPLAYWMARVLLANKEEEAVRILKMLNNASDTTFPLLNKYIPDAFDCAGVLEKLLAENRSKGKAVLLEHKVPSEIIEQVLDDLHKCPSPAYFLVESSMVHKIDSISFLGNWDFRKLYVYRNLRAEKENVLDGLSRIFDLSMEDARSFYTEIVITPSGEGSYEALSKRSAFFGSPVEGKREGDFLYFDNGVVYDLNSKHALVYSSLNRKYMSAKNIFVWDEKEERITNEQGDFEKGILLIKSKDKYKSIVLDNVLAGSLFSRLYFLGGKGLKYFEPFFQDEEAGIYVYKISWNKERVND